MVGIQHITRKKRVFTLIALVGVLFFSTTSFVFASAFQEWILGFSMGTGGFFAGVGGLLLDKAVYFFILQMGDWFVNKGVGAVVTSIWIMIRDLFNILFIFTLVYIGLRTILNSEDSGTKKMLGMLIAAALLINFSLYIAKVVVDVANFTAVQVYTTATSGISGTYGVNYKYQGYGGGILSEENSLAGAYMQVLDISSWFAKSVTGDGVYTYAIIMLFFLMFLGFVFAYGAIMLTARFIAIIFYLMFSPFMFLGWILPQFQQYATKWWKGFIGYSFYAPIYLFMLYIGLYSLQQIKLGLGISGGGGYSSNFAKTGATWSDTNMSIFLLFMIGTGFLVGAMKVAGIVSSNGAAIGMGIANKWSGKIAGAATFGMAARAGRMTGGALGNKIASSNFMQDFASGKRGGKLSPLTQHLARGGITAAEGVADSSFDVRNAGATGTHLQTGKGKKGGYVTRKKEHEKREKKRAKAYGYNKEEAEKAEGDADKEIAIATKELKARQVKLTNSEAHGVISDIRQKIKDESDRLVSDKSLTDEQKGNISRTIEQYREKIKDEMETIGVAEVEAQIKTLEVDKEKKIKEIKQSRAVEHAKTLDEAFLNFIPQIRDMNKSAAKAITDDLNKSKEDKLLDKIDAITKKADNKKEKSTDK